MENILQCRLCAEFKSTNTLININSEAAKNLNLEHRIKDCFDLNFYDSSFPKNVCLSCCDKVGIVFEFQEQVRKAQEILKVSLGENKEDIKEEFTNDDDPTNQPLDYVESILNDGNCIKKEEHFSENDVENYKKSKIEKIVQPKRRGRRKKIIISEPRKKRERKWPQKKKRNLSDPEEAIDRAERGEIIRRITNEWKLYKWTCCDCKEEFPSVDDLRKHFTNVHNKDPQYSCMECSKIYDSYYSFKRHHQKHRKEYNYRCHICLKFFYLKKQYESHLEKHDPNKKVENDRKYVCPTCGKEYNSSSSLRRHLHTFHATTKREYKCETCNKILSSLTNLRNHQNVHNGRKNYICELCGNNFVNGTNLKYHMSSVHSDIKPFSCPHCERTFKLKQLLRVHLQVHSDDKKHACEVCGRRFHRKETLRRHSSVHTGILAFECEYCRKKFRTKQVLTVHIRQHTGVRPYSCDDCNHFFSDSSNYIKHMRGKHGVNSIKKDVTYSSSSTKIESIFMESIVQSKGIDSKPKSNLKSQQ